MKSLPDPARDLRYARWLLERALPQIQGSSWNLAVNDARRALLRISGPYLPDEAALFAQLQAVSDHQLDLWADLKASDR